MQSTSPHQLRLFDPDALPDHPGLELTLRDCFEQFLLPRLIEAQAAGSTIDLYRNALNHWERLTDNGKIRRRDRGLLVDGIDDRMVAEFRAALLAEGRSTDTVAKIWRHLRPIFRRVVRRGPGNPSGMPKGQDLIDDVPYFEPLAAHAREAKIPSAEELSAIYRACSAATWPAVAARRRSGRIPNSALRSRPHAVPAPLQWRTVIVLCATYGLSTCDWLDLTWSNVSFESACPSSQISAFNPHGWLEFVRRKTRRKKPQPLRLPLSATVCGHLKAMESMRAGPHGPSVRVFRWPNSPSTRRRQRNAIQAEAGIEQPYVWKDLRVYANIAWNRLFHGLGAHVLGHAPRDVNSKHYLDHVALLCQLIEQLPDPFQGLSREGGIPNSAAPERAVRRTPAAG